MPLARTLVYGNRVVDSLLTANDWGGIEVNGGDRCTSKNGLVLIEFIGTEDQAKAMAAALQAVDGVYTQVMVFDHPA